MEDAQYMLKKYVDPSIAALSHWRSMFRGGFDEFDLPEPYLFII
jgi:hypothetical protein